MAQPETVSNCNHTKTVVGDAYELASSPISRQEPSRRKVSFAEGDCVAFIPDTRNLSEDEIRSVWYERTEFEAMKKSFRPIIRKMMTGECVEETDEQTCRGLELQTRNSLRRRNQLEAITAVLDEQNRQAYAGLRDAVRLRDVYLSCSARSKDAAFERGQRDELVIQNDHQSHEAGQQAVLLNNSRSSHEKKKRGFSNMFLQRRRDTQQKVFQTSLVDTRAGRNIFGWSGHLAGVNR